MKRILMLVLCLSIVFVSFSACTVINNGVESIGSGSGSDFSPVITPPKTFEVVEVGGYDYSSGANHLVEADLSKQKWNNPQATKSMTLEQNGQPYTLTYQKSTIGYLYEDKHDEYLYRDGTFFLSVNIHPETGKTIFYFWSDTNYPNKVTSEVLSRDECLQLATEYFKTLTPDASEYRLSEEQYREILEYGAVYSFFFVREVNGFKTGDTALIDITVYGDISCYNISSLGSMKDAVPPTESEVAQIEANLDAKLASIYANVADKYTVTYDINEVIFARLADGRYALDYSVNVTLTPIISQDGTTAKTELTRLLVYLD